MPSLAVRVHKMPGMRTVPPATVPSLRLHARPQSSTLSLTAHGVTAHDAAFHAALGKDSGWGP